MNNLSKLLLILTLLILSYFVIHDVNASNWISGQNMSYEIASQTSLIKDNKINIISGATFFPTSRVVQSIINIDGSLNEWGTITGSQTPKASYWQASSYDENKFYLLGGAIYPPTSSISDVYSATINNGTLENWITETSLPTAVSQAASVISNNTIIISGGFNEQSGTTTYTNFVAYNTINPDGTLNSWIETSPLPIPLYGHGMIATDTKVFVFGGRTTNGVYSDNVYQAEVGVDGSLGIWSEVTSLPIPIYRGNIVKTADKVFIAGGVTTDSIKIANVYYSEIQNDGSLGPWIETTSLPIPICCGSLAATDTHLYLAGGVSSNYLSTVYYMQYADLQPSVILDVPDQKQFDPLWKNFEYDHASLWSLFPTIERWGCALTSASMILNYHGIQTNPKLLNNWLLTQPDGYIASGLVNWLAITRYAKQYTSDFALEFSRQPADNNFLINELTQQKPSIVKVPGHFVVVKGSETSDFVVNDPASIDTLLSQVETAHEGNYSQIYSFTPSYTDLSYLMLVAPSEVEINAFDPTGNPITQGFWQEEPLNDDLDSSSTSGETVNQFLIPKPDDGVYKITLTGNGLANIKTYLYNASGQVKINETNQNLDDESTLYVYVLAKEGKVYHGNIGELLSLVVNNKEKILKESAYNLLISKISQINRLLVTNRLELAENLLIKLKQNIYAHAKHANITDIEYINDLINTIEAIITDIN